jgi:hypothetical protein
MTSDTPPFCSRVPQLFPDPELSLETMQVSETMKSHFLIFFTGRKHPQDKADQEHSADEYD